MGQRTRTHLISIRILLIATAIRALTPDWRDLASERAAHLLCPFLDPSGTCEHEDPSGDDVSGPIVFGQRVVVPMRRNRTAGPRLVSAGSAKRMSKIDAFQFAFPGGTPLRINGLVLLLCRLTC